MTNPIVREAPLRVLVVDDSAYNRRTSPRSSAPSAEVEVVGKAADGEEALRLVDALKPDVITLDLEMPRMDGFTFLRILMSKMPTPVIVVSSYSQKENVFKALELGALDFVAKPDRYSDAELHDPRRALQKVLLARYAAARRRLSAHARQTFESLSGVRSEPASHTGRGGPAAALRGRDRVVDRRTYGADRDLRAAAASARRTRSDRAAHARQVHPHLRRAARQRSSLRVSEAQDVDARRPGHGASCAPAENAWSSRARARTAPSGCASCNPASHGPLRAERRSAVQQRRASRGPARHRRDPDGHGGRRRRRSARDPRARAASVIAESEETAVVYGMPGSAVRAGVVTRSLPLPEIVDTLCALGE